VQSIRDKSISFVFESIIFAFSEISTQGETDFVMFSCDAQGNQMGNIDYINLGNINFIYYVTIDSLDVSGLTQLTDLYCGGNSGLIALELPSSLTILNVDGNRGLAPYLSTILLNLPNLERLGCRNMNLANTLNVSGLEQLIGLYCGGNSDLIALELPSSLTILYVYGNTGLAPELPSILSSVPNLQVLICGDMFLETLDVSGLAQLKYFDCGDNPGLTTLNLSNCTSLSDLSSIIDTLPTITTGTLTITGVPGSDDPDLIQQAETKGWTVIL
jgi:hypothetical protein